MYTDADEEMSFWSSGGAHLGRERATAPLGSVQKPDVDEEGVLHIDSGVKIRAFQYAWREDIKKVHIKKPVREISFRAFADCPNLEELILEDSVKTIDKDAFAGTGLKRVVLPDKASVWSSAFNCCENLEEPIFSRNGKILHAYPKGLTAEIYVVPEGVREIGAGCFTGNPHLKKVILPETVKELHPRAFEGSYIKELEILNLDVLRAWVIESCPNLKILKLPNTVRIEACAICNCNPDLRIIAKKRLSADKYYHVQCRYCLKETGTLPDYDHTTEEAFVTLTEKCSAGDAEAMWALAEYFFKKEGSEWYKLAGNFWAYTAYWHRSEEAAAWFARWEAQLQREGTMRQLPAALNEARAGEAVSGKLLRYLGYFAFDPEKFYRIGTASNDGTAIASCVCGVAEKRNTHYDFFIMDEYLNLLGTVHHVTDFEWSEYRELLDFSNRCVRMAWKKNGKKRKEENQDHWIPNILW